jgi:glucose-fructose oxidoreductase
MALRASGRDPRFAEVDEMVSAVLRFPEERLAAFTIGFGAADTSHYRVVGTHGDLVVEPAYDYVESLVHRMTIDGKTRTRKFPRSDQFAPELLYFSDCVLNDAEPEPSGLEGLCDVQIVEALGRSADAGRPIALSLPRRSRRPGIELALHRPPVRKPEVVHAQSATR